ncbi:HlyD family secretion protein [Paenacidovorax caeni]|uniref:HlyD family secretion protein n=1 Tax=Paenacidovorax caeni TaxID=343013 RepID=A0A1I7I377_9BURK|nr:efflux RND transporter periplasmic adaptor subunit [Paenacidovorax caeni]SFU67364.1 HlyD family secretion protein [Paenacidovorax caeni]
MALPFRSQPLPKLRRWGIPLAFLAVALAVAVAWWSARSIAVPAVAAQTQPLLRTLQVTARVATLSRVEVGATLTGRVQSVLVREGDTVRAGAPLVELETDELRAAWLQAVANEQQAKARLQGLRTTGRVTAKAGVAQADASVLAAQAELRRGHQLVAQGFISASRLDELQRAVDVALAQQRNANAQRQANADTGTDLAQAQAQLAVARASTQAAAARLAQATVRAPTDATVLLRTVEPGQIVQPGKALLQLALAGPTQLVAQLDERFLEQLEVGQRATVIADAFPNQRLQARVLSMAPGVDAQRGSIEVKLALQAAPPTFLREDMTLSVEIETGRRPQALALPLSALRHIDGDTATVYIAQDGRAQAQSVRLGLRNLVAAEITQGLAADALVLLGPRVRPGMRVRPQAQPWHDDSTSSPTRAGGRDSDAGAALTHAVGR